MLCIQRGAQVGRPHSQLAGRADFKGARSECDCTKPNVYSSLSPREAATNPQYGNEGVVNETAKLCLKLSNTANSLIFVLLTVARHNIHVPSTYGVTRTAFFFCK